MIQMSDASMVGHMRPKDGDHVDKLLSMYIFFSHMGPAPWLTFFSSTIHRQWIK